MQKEIGLNPGDLLFFEEKGDYNGGVFFKGNKTICIPFPFYAVVKSVDDLYNSSKVVSLIINGSEYTDLAQYYDTSTKYNYFTEYKVTIFRNRRNGK